MVSTPALIAFSPTALPTKAAISDLLPLAFAIALSLEDAAAIVLPVTSSTT
jgi:hypothetical protein